MRRVVLLLPMLLACGVPIGPRPVPVTVINESGNAMNLITDNIQVLYPHQRWDGLRLPGDSIAVADPYVRRAIVVRQPSLWRVWLGSDSLTAIRSSPRDW